MCLDPTALKLFEYSSLVFLCLRAPSHKIGFKSKIGFETYLVRRRSKTQKYKGALFEQLGERLGLSKTEQKTRQQNKTQGSKQDKQIINQNIRVLTPLVFVVFFS